MIAGVGASLCAAVLTPVSLVEGGPTFCPFLLLTGWPCPTCGMTRAWVLLGHGRWSESLSYNPVGPLVLATVLIWFGVLLWRRVGHPSPQWFGKLLVPLVVIAVGAYGIARIVLVANGQWEWDG
nr:DUF2752 domain-containing protein [Yimella sp. cx-51]